MDGPGSPNILAIAGGSMNSTNVRALTTEARTYLGAFDRQRFSPTALRYAQQAPRYSGGLRLRDRRRQTNLLVEKGALNPLRLCPVQYSVKFSGWKGLYMRLVPESGVPQRRKVTRLAGYTPTATRPRGHEKRRQQRPLLALSPTALVLSGFRLTRGCLAGR